MSDWLYPLSSKVNTATGMPNYHFKLGDGTPTPDTSPASLALIVKDSPGQDGWVVHSNRVNGKVQRGDRVWFYYGHADGDLGVVAAGTVTDLDPDEGVSFTWKKAATRKLMATPVPASVIRRYVQRPRRALWALDKYPRLVSRLTKAAGL